jgi:hypothetical protein
MAKIGQLFWSEKKQRNRIIPSPVRTGRMSLFHFGQKIVNFHV